MQPSTVGGDAPDRPVRGLVRRGSTVELIDRRIWPANDDLAPWVEHFWTLDWELTRHPPITSAVITFPAMHLTAEWGEPAEVRHGVQMPATLVHGLVSEVFSATVRGAGGVVGARFRPNGFAAWAGVDASAFTDRVLPAVDVLGPAYAELHRAAQAACDTAERVASLAELLRARRPSTPPSPELAELVDRMAADETLTRVEQLIQLSGWTSRTLQRRFRREVGINPKWVLVRFRLQSAALALERDPDVDLATLAVQLGWYDQAHLTNDFRRMLGETPGEYAAKARGDLG